MTDKKRINGEDLDREQIPIMLTTNSICQQPNLALLNEYLLTVRARNSL
jgi:hypothetical protein